MRFFQQLFGRFPFFTIMYVFANVLHVHIGYVAKLGNSIIHLSLILGARNIRHTGMFKINYSMQRNTNIICHCILHLILFIHITIIIIGKTPI